MTRVTGLGFKIQGFRGHGDMAVDQGSLAKGFMVKKVADRAFRGDGEG